MRRRLPVYPDLLAEQGHYSEAEEVCRDDLGLSGRIQRCAQQCLGAPWFGGMSVAARRARRIGGRAKKACLCNGPCGRTDPVFVHVSNGGSGQKTWRLFARKGEYALDRCGPLLGLGKNARVSDWLGNCKLPS